MTAIYFVCGAMAIIVCAILAGTGLMDPDPELFEDRRSSLDL